MVTGDLPRLWVQTEKEGTVVIDSKHPGHRTCIGRNRTRFTVEKDYRHLSRGQVRNRSPSGEGGPSREISKGNFWWKLDRKNMVGFFCLSRKGETTIFVSQRVTQGETDTRQGQSVKTGVGNCKS